MPGTDTAKTTIAEDIEISGSIKCASNIQFDGKLNGDMNCNGNATIGSTANIKGNISVESITVHGTINGNVLAKDKIDLKSTAHVSGDIKAKRLTVEDGVTFIGKSDVGASGSGQGRTSEPKAESAEVHKTPDEPRQPAREEQKSGGLFGRR